MKSSLTAVFVSAMLLACASVASAASFIQASSTDEQVATDNKPKVVTMNSTDASKGITQEKGIVTVSEDGTYFVMVAAQVGGKTKGSVRLWMKVNDMDADNSNTEQFISDPTFTAVLVCQGLMELKKGDKVQAAYSGSARSLGLVVKKPAGEPVVPSVIFSAWKID